jgi:hypothetical protein
MSHVAVTLEYDNTNKDLALPLDVTVRILVDSLVESLRLRKVKGKRYALSIKTEQGLRPISPNATLADANVLHGMVLMLFYEDKTAGETLSKTGASLQAENGRMFPLPVKVSIIGRNDAKSGTFVDVDLTPLVTDSRILSRRHAQIEQEGERFYLTDLASTNGTSLNGQPIPAKEKRILHEGDIIEFGRKGPKLTFVIPRNDPV